MLYSRIKELCKERGITITKLENELGFARGSISKIDKHKPSAEKLEKIATFFGMSYNGLVRDEYYLDDLAKQYTDFLKSHPDYKVLFDASCKVSPKDIFLVQALIERFNDESATDPIHY